MKWSISKYLFIFVLLPLMSLNAQMRDSSRVYQSVVKESHYDKRVHRYRKNWEAVIPNIVKVQYAGNMGMFSAGVGWDYGKRRQWETDLYFGFIPPHSSGKTKMTMTLKQDYIPWSIQLKPSVAIEPLATGLYLNTVFGDEFWTHEPERYPKGYYQFSSRVRIHVYLGQRVSFNVHTTDFWSFARNITLFYEVSSYDLMIASAVSNHYLKPKDYLSLSVGAKFLLF